MNRLGTKGIINLFHLFNFTDLKNDLFFLILALILILSYIILRIKNLRLSNHIHNLSTFDVLTGLPNYKVLEHDMGKLLKRETFHAFSIIMIDFDNFSSVNQHYGYPSGDALIIEAANRIKGIVCENCTIYKFKGAEFIVLCNSRKSDAEILSMAQTILKVLANYYYIDGICVDLNFNIGIYSHRELNLANDSLKAVTHAKNYAKYLGCNQIQHYDHETYRDLHRSIELQANIINGLLDNQFFLVYQPLFRLENEELAEVEALIRWKHPQLGLLYPDRFIELAERTGKIINIDYWVLEAACKQLSNWKINKVPLVMLAINLSSKTLEMTSFITDLKEMLEKYEIDPSYLQIELTERMIIRNMDECSRIFNELRKMGIRIAIDDFGIGYSSLSYIVRLSIDSIKIDKSFVRQIVSSKEAETIVASVINLCKSLKINVIAEGIEKKAELDYLMLCHCDIGQGYYFSIPLELNELENTYLRN